MTEAMYRHIKKELYQGGYAGEIDWQTNLKPCNDANDFMGETCWVILNSGMKEQIARKIWERIQEAWLNGKTAFDVFKHTGKCQAIEFIRTHKDAVFAKYLESDNKIDYLEKTIFFIGKITKYHLAKNLGHDCVKPDRHLVRIAGKVNKTPDELCKELSDQTGDKVCVIDIVLWRAANLGMI
jgi:hypothetical protein